MPGARRRRLEREAAAALPACARGRGASATATAVAAESAPPSRPARVSPLAQLRSRCARPRPLRGRRRRCSCTSSGLARHCNRSPSRHARRVMKGPWRRRSLAPLGIRPRLRIGAKVNGGRFTWPKFDKKKKKSLPARASPAPPRQRGLRLGCPGGGGVGPDSAPAGPRTAAPCSPLSARRPRPRRSALGLLAAAPSTGPRVSPPGDHARQAAPSCEMPC